MTHEYSVKTITAIRVMKHPSPTGFLTPHPLVILLFFSLPRPQAITHLLVISIDVSAFSRFFFNRNGILQYVLFLFVLLPVLRFIHVSCIGSYFFLLLISVHCIDILQFVYSFTCPWIFGFPFLGSYKESHYDIWGQVFMWIYIFISLG